MRNLLNELLTKPINKQMKNLSGLQKLISERVSPVTDSSAVGLTENKTFKLNEQLVILYQYVCPNHKFLVFETLMITVQFLKTRHRMHNL